MNWLRTLKAVNWKRHGLQKLSMVAILLMLSGAAYAVSHNWTLIVAWFMKPADQASCFKGDIHAGANAQVVVNCGQGKIEAPAKGIQPESAPAVAKADPRPDPMMNHFALRMLDPRPLNPVVLAVDEVTAQKKKKQKPSRVANNGKSRAKAKGTVGDPFWLREFREIPLTDSVIAYQPIELMRGSCLLDRYLPCYLPPGFGRETPVRVDDELGRRLLNGRGQY